MKRYLDYFFCKKMNEDSAYVVSSDVGYFPKARQHKNFIDAGNDEFALGPIVAGLLESGHDVYVYDICGYVLKNGYSGFAYRKQSKNKLVVLSWGSGFSYDGCLLGHYPIDDIHLAKLCGFNIVFPYNKISFLKCLNSITEDSYIRMFNLDDWEYKGSSNSKADITFVAEGWIAHFLEDSFGNIVHVKPYISGHRYGSSDTYYFTDQIQTEFNRRIIGPVHPLKIDEKSYECKEAFLKSCFIEPIKEILGLE